jgi:hypothetical protein
MSIRHFVEDFSDTEIHLALKSPHTPIDQVIKLLNEQHSRQVEELEIPVGHEFSWNGERYSSR